MLQTFSCVHQFAFFISTVQLKSPYCMELNVKNTFPLFRLYYFIVSCFPIY
jgi:hypothetical protein